MDQALYNQYYGNLGNIYNPQVATVNSQKAGVAADAAAALSGLEQAKVNAFRDITEQSNTRGGFFSGFRPDAQATYTGEKYLPAVAGVKKSQRDALTALQDALNQITASRRKDAMGLYQNEIDRRTEERRYQQQRADEAAAQAASRASSSRSYSSGGGGGGGGGGTTKPTTYTDEKINVMLDTMFKGYNPKAKDQYTEKTVLPYLQNQGISLARAAKLTYNYRKSIFGE